MSAQSEHVWLISFTRLHQCWHLFYRVSLRTIEDILERLQLEQSLLDHSVLQTSLARRLSKREMLPGKLLNNLFPTQNWDVSRYMPAKIILVACLGAAVVVSISLRVLYHYRNRRADRYNQPAMSHFERNAVRFAGASLDFADRSYRYAFWWILFKYNFD